MPEQDRRPLRQRLFALEEAGDMLLQEIEEAGGLPMPHALFAMQNFKQAIDWMKKGVE